VRSSRFIGIPIRSGSFSTRRSHSAIKVWLSRKRMSATDSTVAAPSFFPGFTEDATGFTITLSQGHNRVFTILLNVVSSNFDDQLGTGTGTRHYPTLTPCGSGLVSQSHVCADRAANRLSAASIAFCLSTAITVWWSESQAFTICVKSHKLLSEFVVETIRRTTHFRIGEKIGHKQAVDSARRCSSSPNCG
jgi:hypothetical protein